MDGILVFKKVEELHSDKSSPLPPSQGKSRANYGKRRNLFRGMSITCGFLWLQGLDSVMLKSNIQSSIRINKGLKRNKMYCGSNVSVTLTRVRWMLGQQNISLCLGLGAAGSQKCRPNCPSEGWGGCLMWAKWLSLHPSVCLSTPSAPLPNKLWPCTSQSVA